MNKPWHAPTRVALVIAAVLTLPTAAFAQVKVIISGGFSAAYRELLPEFERTTGIKVTTTSGGSVGTGPNTIGGQLRRGVPADMVIAAVARGDAEIGLHLPISSRTLSLQRYRGVGCRSRVAPHLMAWTSRD